MEKSSDRPVTKKGFEAKPRVDQWNRFTENSRLNNKSKDFTRERAPSIWSIDKTYNILDIITKFIFTDSRTEKEIAYKYHHWGGRKKIRDNV